MGLSVVIIPPEGFPDPEEKIVNFSYAEGNIVSAVNHLGFERLDELELQEQIEALRCLILELSKGDNGDFNDVWCEMTDKLWSNGKEMKRVWKEDGYPLLKRIKQAGVAPAQVLGYTNMKEYWGRQKRQHLREDAQRFMLYLMAGYKVEFVP